MFWLWFFVLGIVGKWLACTTTIPKLRRSAPLELLQALALVGLTSFILGAFVSAAVDSGFFSFLMAALSWAGIVCVPELIKRRKFLSNNEYYRELDQEIAQSKTPVPRIRKPDQNFMEKTSFEFPLKPQNIQQPPVKDLADILAESVAKHSTADTYIKSSPNRKTLLDKEQNQVRSELLTVLSAFCESYPDVGAGQEVVDVLAPAPPVPNIFSTPILDAVAADGSLGVISRFSGTPSKTLGEPLLAADLVSESNESEEGNLEGFMYKPKLVESKFSKPIE